MFHLPKVLCSSLQRLILWVISCCVFIGLPINAYAQMGVLATVDEQWLCDQQQNIFARVDEGDPEAQYHAGMLFYQGACVLRDLPFAFELFVQAADGGHINSYHIVAVMSHIGLGTKRDLESADKLFFELLKSHYPPTVNYACTIQQGVDPYLKRMPVLESLINYTGCPS